MNRALAFDHSHNGWNEIVKGSVSWSNSASTVNYIGIKTNSKTLDKYLNQLSSVKNSEFESWSHDERLAFLINAYNAWTVKLVVENYPVKSIKKIGGIFSSPWKLNFFKLFGQETNLDWIEHQKIRITFKEPRIHFALVCASIGCPGLRAEAFVAEKLSQQLEDSARRFLNDSSRNFFDRTKKELALSSIFKWYKEDFVLAKGTVQAFVYTYMDTLKSETLESAQKLSVKYLEYNWSLNEK